MDRETMEKAKSAISSIVARSVNDTEVEEAIVSTINKYFNEFAVGFDLANTHRTLQQMIMNMFLGFIAGEYVNAKLNMYDRRNMLTVKLAVEIINCLKNSDDYTIRKIAERIEKNIEDIANGKYPADILPMV